MNSDEGLARLALMCAMAAMLVVSLSVPGAFNEDGRAFAIAYLVVRQLQTVALWLCGGPTTAVRRAIRRLAVTSLLGPVLILAATWTDGTVQAAMWGLALGMPAVCLFGGTASYFLGHVFGSRRLPLRCGGGRAPRDPRSGRVARARRALRRTPRLDRDCLVSP